MASRKEQKERLRREREEREAAERAAARRRQLIGYAAGAAVVILALAVAGFLLASGGGDDEGGGSGETSADVLPDGGEMPEEKITDLKEAAGAANCEMKSFPGGSRDHLTDIGETVKYSSDPPTSGKHFETPAQDGSYEEAPDIKTLVHSLEHGRVIIWFKTSLPAQDRANLKALFDEDPYQMILVPHDSMSYDVAATAWNREPEDLGTGRLLGCDTYNDKVFDAIRAFKEENRGRGPEAVP